MGYLLVIIVTYNAMKWAEHCFNSIVNSSVEVDIFVVDNGSTDGTQDYIKKNYSNVVIHQCNENLGFGKANNIGLQYALDNNYSYVYLLNQDAWIFPETIERLIELHKKYPEYGILSPFQMNADLYHIDKSFITNVCAWYSCPDIMNDLYNKDVSIVYPVTNVMAAHWFLPISTIKKVGGFSPSFPHYGEDDNYLERVLYNKLKIGIVPSLRVVHDRGGRIETVNMKMYMSYIGSIIAISNPSKKVVDGLLLSLLLMLQNMLKYKSLRPMVLFVKLLYSLPSIIKNKKESLKDNVAFLSL